LVAASLGPAVLATPKPAELANVIRADAPFGTASMHWLWMTAYDAELWTDAPKWSMSSPFALTLRYHHSFDGLDIVERTIKEMHNVDPSLGKDRLAAYRAKLVDLFPSVKPGDEITALYAPGAPVRFFYNGRLTGELDDADFAKPFFGIWLSPRTSDPALRAQLLRKNA
jgi:hypothetical protein